MLDIAIPQQIDICVLANTIDNLSKPIQRLVTLGFMSVKRIILKNWKIRKPECFYIQNWVKDFINLLSMESAIIYWDPYGEHINEMTLKNVKHELQKRLAVV